MPTARNSTLSVLSRIRLILLLFLIFSLNLLAQNETAVSLKSVLNNLEKQFSIRFSFDPNALKGIKLNSIPQTNDLDLALQAALSNTALEFQKIDDQYYVIKKAASKFLTIEVLDAETDLALPFATIQQNASNLGLVTDEFGLARLVIPNHKGVVLEVFYLGFQSFSIHVDSLNSYQVHQVHLLPEPLDLNDYELKEYLNAGIASDPKANSFRILPQEMEILPGLAERDVLLSAQIISGVNSNDESASGINVRGSSRDNTLLYWNNVPIYHSAHYFGNISSFIPSSIGTLDVYKNYVPVKYGGASAGLISLASRNEINQTLNAELSINMTHGDAFIKTPFLGKKGSVMFAARRSYNDAIPTWTYNAYGEKLFGREIRDPQGIVYESEYSNDLNFSDLNFHWNYEPTDKTSIKLGYIRNRSQFNHRENDLRERQNIVQSHQIKSSGADISWIQRLTDKQSLSVSAAYSDYGMEYDYTNLRNPTIDSDDDKQERSNDIENLELRLSHTSIYKDLHKLTIGYQFNKFKIRNLINTENFFEQDQAEQINSEGNIHAVFSDLNLKLSAPLELILSGRLTAIESINRSVFSPQIKLNYNLNEQLLFKTTYGIYHQYLSTIKESQFTISNAIEQHWLLADDDELVPMLINKQVSLGFIRNTKSWLIDFDIYQKNVDGLLARNLGFGFTREAGFNQGTERIVGADLTLRKRWKYIKTWFSYNFQDSEVSFSELFPTTFASNLNIRHQFNFSSTLSRGNWEFSVGYTFKTGAPYTGINNVRLNRKNNSPNPPGPGVNEKYELRFSKPNSLRVANYHRFDASVWHRFKGKTWQGEVGFSLMNIFNRRNVNNIGYLIDLNQNNEVVIAQRTKFFLEFTPNLSVRFSF